jgi:hypothetical protein
MFNLLPISLTYVLSFLNLGSHFYNYSPLDFVESVCRLQRFTLSSFLKKVFDVTDHLSPINLELLRVDVKRNKLVVSLSCFFSLIIFSSSSFAFVTLNFTWNFHINSRESNKSHDI